jgi:hypothetical protein
MVPQSDAPVPMATSAESLTVKATPAADTLKLAVSPTSNSSVRAVQPELLSTMPSGYEMRRRLAKDAPFLSKAMLVTEIGAPVARSVNFTSAV